MQSPDPEESYSGTPPSRSTSPYMAPSQSTPPRSNGTAPSKPRPSRIPIPIEPYRDEPPPSNEHLYTDARPARDNPSTASAAGFPPRPGTYHQAPPTPSTPSQYQVFPPYTDDASDDDVPLAHLYPYPNEAPPAYHVAVRQSYRDTLIAHIPSTSIGSLEDEEADWGSGDERPDDVRFAVEKIVTMLVIAFVMLGLAGFFLWMAFVGLKTG
ncbi:hypothetical protein P154DRAFT_495342 [Amniculicola lignicola CBS 123094]|uniref:Uncharacterized protein n=1 Tax=Amniculicola lignicola CBS 123094 TaxID=1392246 RepID=A0A6A5WDY5_9PLEO|nr:hypothetical protein P154DRAFT_495342 [Amniculicola lignicola CBS 123094]